MDFEIVKATGPKRPRDESLLEAYETRSYYDVVYTPQIAAAAEAPKEPPAAPAVPAVPAEPAEDDVDAADESDAVVESEDLDAEAFYARFVARSPEQAAAELEAPQRSDAWLAARKHAITASNFGAAAGHNKYCSPAECALDKLWGTFKGNEYTIYGTFHEPDARRTFEALLDGELKPTLEAMYAAATGGGYYKSHVLFETGLLKAHQQPWMAVSPDGLLRLQGSRGYVWLLAEYKCPARLRDSESHPYAKSLYNVPEYYMDQIQGIMGLLNKWPDLLALGAASAGVDHDAALAAKGTVAPVAAFFVVWQPKQIHVTRVPYDKAYYTETLEPALEDFFFKRYLPLAVLKHNGALVEGTDTAAPVIEV